LDFSSEDKLHSTDRSLVGARKFCEIRYSMRLLMMLVYEHCLCWNPHRPNGIKLTIGVILWFSGDVRVQRVIYLTGRCPERRRRLWTQLYHN